jgi:hypothetical protein
VTDLVLQRNRDGKAKATLGKCVVSGRNIYTLEPALGGKMPGEPVPAGVYRLVPHDSAKYGRIWAMVNPDLGVYHQLADAPADKRATARFACLFVHSGNFDQDSLGCVIAGLATRYEVDKTSKELEPGVFNSKAAVALVKELLPWVEHRLTILDPA